VQSAYRLYDAQYASYNPTSSISWTPEQREALKKNYRLLDAGRPFDYIRDSLLSSARNGRCPLCGQRQVASLDHYLPISVFPEFSVLSRNLVPCCPQCNHAKSASMADPTGARFFHPYFDALPDEELLVADVTVSESISVRYHIAHPSSVPQQTVKNLEFHFRVLGLGDYYQAEANQELFDRVGVFRSIYSGENGSRSLAHTLSREAESIQSERGLNNWKVALYKSLAQSADFCNGGFETLVPSGYLGTWD
jgi:hypothetical protein